MTEDCAHCGLPTPSPPVTASSVSGGYCCLGCLEVARALAEHDDDEIRAHDTDTPSTEPPA